MYSLSEQNKIGVFLKNNGNQEAIVGLGINHREIMILPLEKEFPFLLHPYEDNYFIVEISRPGYLEMVVRKCNEGTPSIAYTFNYADFQAGQFEIDNQLSDSPKTHYFIKVQPATMYIRLSSLDSLSLLSLFVRFTEDKKKGEEMRAGRSGDIAYSILDWNRAEITVARPICGRSSCPNDLRYILMSGSTMVHLYTQLVCPSNFFSSLEIVSIEPIREEEVTGRVNSDGTLSFELKLGSQISYAGLKVVNSKTQDQIYYRPIEIATVWGQLSRTSG